VTDAVAVALGQTEAGAVIVAVGAVLTVTTVGADVAVQPFPSVKVTL
jgi:hypothetical protein